MKKNETTLKIEQYYPAPIAATCRKIRVLDEDDVVAKHDSLGDLAEAVIKYLAIISLQDIRDTGGLPEYLSKFLQNILNPSLGHWNEILRMCSQETNDQNKVASSVKQFYEQAIKDSAREPINQITSLLKSKMKVRKNKDLISLLILYRNKIWKGHGSKLTSEEYRSILDALNNVLLYLIGEIEFVTEYELIYVDEIVVVPTGEFKHKIQRGMGSQVEPESFNLTQAMKTNHVYLKIPGDEEMHYIDLHPLLVSYPCPDCKSQQFYFFNDYRKNRLEFLSYACGHLIYPDMLPNEVENFLNVSLVGAGKTAHAYENLDEETQTTQLIKSAKLKISTREYHEALDLFLTANSIRTSWETNYYLALLKMVLGYSLNDIVLHVNTCIDLEPDNQNVQKLHEFINTEYPSEESLKEPTPDKLEKTKKHALSVLSKEVYSPSVNSVFWVFCPSFFRNYAMYFWIIVPVALLIIRAYLSHYLDWPVTAHEIILKSSIIIVFVPIVFYLTNKIQDIYIILNQRLTDNAREYFPRWFQDQLDNNFGRFLTDKSIKNSINIRDQKNRSYLLLALAFFVISYSAFLVLTCYNQNDPGFVLLQAFDYLLISGICSLGTPILAKNYLMLKNFSSFPIKPLLGQMDTFMMRKIGRMIFLLSIPWTLLGFLVVLLGYLTFSPNIVVIQILLLCLLIFIGITWTVLTPYYFNKSLGKAKDKVVLKYGKHIEEKFNQFIENPDYKDFENLKWLISTQKEIKSIRISIISFGDFLGIIFINAFIFIIGFLYPFMKWRISLNDVQEWLNSLFINI